MTTRSQGLSRLVAGTLLTIPLAACGLGGGGDYLAVAGGGFQFNYRVAEATYHLVAEVKRPLPDGARVEAVFEDPQGGPALVVARPEVDRDRRKAFSSPPVHGVRKDVPYKVTLRLIDGAGAVIETHEKQFVSNVDGAIMPEKPLTVGPGYHRNVTGTSEAFPQPAPGAPK